MRDLRRDLSSSFELVSRPTSMYLAEACLAAAAQRSAERANSGAYSAEPSAPTTTTTVGWASATGREIGDAALKAAAQIRRSQFIGGWFSRSYRVSAATNRGPRAGRL